MGLKNLGNTCWWNSVLQCFTHVEPFAAYFLTDKYKEELNADPEQRRFLDAFAGLQRELWQSDVDRVDPTQFTNAFKDDFDFLFDGNQQDANEGFLFLAGKMERVLNAKKTEERSDDKHGGEREDERRAARAWMRHLASNKSVVLDLFYGQERRRTTCLECNYVCRSFNPILFMPLPMNKNTRTLSDCWDVWVKEKEQVGNEGVAHCEGCMEVGWEPNEGAGLRPQGYTQYDLWKMPPVLVVTLIRFEETGAKITYPIEADLQWDCSRMTDSLHKEPLMYELVGVVDHLGDRANSGHYTATCLHRESGVYHKFDDSVVSPVDEGNVVTPEAYMFFYQRVAVSDVPFRRQSIRRPSGWPHRVSASEVRGEWLLPK